MPLHNIERKIENVRPQFLYLLHNSLHCSIEAKQKERICVLMVYIDYCYDYHYCIALAMHTYSGNCVELYFKDGSNDSFALI